MKKILIILLTLTAFPFYSFATGFGLIKVVVPLKNNIVMIDGVTVEVEENDRIIARVTSGDHFVQLVNGDGIAVFGKTVRVNEKEVATVIPDISGPIKMEQSILGQKLPSKEVPKIQETIDDTKWGGGFGVGVGVDNTNFILSGNKNSTRDIGIQYSLSLLYARPLFEQWLTDFSFDVLRQGGSYDNDQVTALPLTFSVKRRMDNNYMLGFGLNYSMWQKSSDIDDIAPGVGMHIFTEIKPISTEIGYIVKSGTMDYLSSDKTYANSSGLYFKYKFYL